MCISRTNPWGRIEIIDLLSDVQQMLEHAQTGDEAAKVSGLVFPEDWAVDKQIKDEIADFASLTNSDQDKREEGVKAKLKLLTDKKIAELKLCIEKAEWKDDDVKAQFLTLLDIAGSDEEYAPKEYLFLKQQLQCYAALWHGIYDTDDIKKLIASAEKWVGSDLPEDPILQHAIAGGDVRGVVLGALRERVSKERCWAENNFFDKTQPPRVSGYPTENELPAGVNPLSDRMAYGPGDTTVLPGQYGVVPDQFVGKSRFLDQARQMALLCMPQKKSVKITIEQQEGKQENQFHKDGDWNRLGEDRKLQALQLIARLMAPTMFANRAAKKAFEDAINVIANNKKYPEENNEKQYHFLRKILRFYDATYKDKNRNIDKILKEFELQWKQANKQKKNADPDSARAAVLTQMQEKLESIMPAVAQAQDDASAIYASLPHTPVDPLADPYGQPGLGGAPERQSHQYGRVALTNVDYDIVEYVSEDRLLQAESGGTHSEYMEIEIQSAEDFIKELNADIAALQEQLKALGDEATPGHHYGPAPTKTPDNEKIEELAAEKDRLQARLDELRVVKDQESPTLRSTIPTKEVKYQSTTARLSGVMGPPSRELDRAPHGSRSTASGNEPVQQYGMVPSLDDADKKPAEKPYDTVPEQKPDQTATPVRNTTLKR